MNAAVDCFIANPNSDPISAAYSGSFLFTVSPSVFVGVIESLSNGNYKGTADTVLINAVNGEILDQGITDTNFPLSAVQVLRRFRIQENEYCTHLYISTLPSVNG